MKKALFVDGRQRRTQILADASRFASPEWTAGLDDLLQRLADDELHPEADAVVMLLSPVDVDDVRVTEPRQTTPLVERPDIGVRAAEPVFAKQLQRHMPVQAGIPGAVHVGRGTLADSFEHDERSPPRAGWFG